MGRGCRISKTARSSVPDNGGTETHRVLHDGDDSLRRGEPGSAPTKNSGVSRQSPEVDGSQTSCRKKRLAVIARGCV